MDAVAGDAGEGSWVAPLGEPAQKLRVELASSAGAGDGRCRHTGLGRPLEGGQAPRWLPTREADDLIISLEDEPFLGGAERTDAGSDLTKGRDVDFPTDGCVLALGR
jgi:hypothetical protein